MAKEFYWSIESASRKSDHKNFSEKYEVEKWRKRDQKESETIVDGFINDETCIAVSESEESGVMNEPVVDFTPVYLARKCMSFSKIEVVLYRK